MTIPSSDHPITLTPTGQRVMVRAGGRVIADTTAALGLAEAQYPVVQYIPRADVDADALRPTDTVTSCPYKGEATYFSIVTADGELTDAVWTYREPYPSVAPIAGHLAFYPDKVAIQVGGA